MELLNRYIKILKNEGGYKLFVDNNSIKIIEYKGSNFFGVFIFLFVIVFWIIPLSYDHFNFILILAFLFSILLLFLSIYSLIKSFVFKVCLNRDKITIKKLIGFKIKIYSLSYSDVSVFFILYNEEKKSANILLKKETGEEIQILSFNDIKKENVARLKVALKCLNNSLKDNYLSLPNEVKQ